MIFKRAAKAIEHVWASWPFIGIMALFIAISFGVFEGYKARQSSERSVAIAKENRTTLEDLKNTQQAVINEKDRRIAEKDTQLANATIVVGQVYDAALALQQQVIMLGGKPKTIPVTIPQIQPSKTRPNTIPNPTKTVTNSSTVTTTVNDCKLGIDAAPLNIVQLHVCIPPSYKGP